MGKNIPLKIKEKLPRCHISMAGGAKWRISSRVGNSVAPALLDSRPVGLRNSRQGIRYFGQTELCLPKAQMYGLFSVYRSLQISLHNTCFKKWQTRCNGRALVRSAQEREMQHKSQGIRILSNAVQGPSFLLYSWKQKYSTPLTFSHWFP